jgi:hypothetical protein
MAEGVLCVMEIKKKGTGCNLNSFLKEVSESCFQ